MITVILLAAGLSRRMGAENKLLLPFGDSTVVETTLRAILAAEVGSVVVVVGHEAALLKAVLANYPVEIVENTAYEQGMTTSIQAGVRHVGTSAGGFMICLSDMPLIPSDEYRLLTRHFETRLTQDAAAIVRPIVAGKMGNPSVFAPVYAAEMLELTYTEGCKPIIEKHKNHLYAVEMPSDATLRDMDVKAEYEQLKKP